MPGEPATAALGRWRVWLLAALCGGALVTRLLRAWQLSSISPDAVVYLEIAQAMANQAEIPYPREVHWQLFPALLAALYRMGVPLETAGLYWNVLAASLAVWPLFGWLRRLAGEWLALVGTGLYVVHGKLIETAPDIVREPTFWLAAATCLYCGERLREVARQASAGSQPLPAGQNSPHRGTLTELGPVLWWLGSTLAALALAVLARIEGLVLLLPLAWRTLPVIRNTWHTRRLRLTVGGVACLAALAGLVGWFACAKPSEGATSWRATPLAIAELWLRAWGGNEEVAGAAVNGTNEILPPRRGALPLWPRVRMLATALRGALTPPFIILLVAGLWLAVRGGSASQLCGDRDPSSERDWRPLGLATLAIVAAMGMHLWYDGETTSRYALTLVLLLLPYFAAGAMALAELAAAWWSAGRPPRHAVVGSLAVLFAGVTLAGLVNAYWNGPDKVAARKRIAECLHQRLGPHRVLVGSPDASRLVGYYAKWQAHTLPKQATVGEIEHWLKQKRPDAVLLNERYLAAGTIPEFAALAPSLAYVPLDTAAFAPEYPELKLFIRSAPAPRTALR